MVFNCSYFALVVSICYTGQAKSLLSKLPSRETILFIFTGVLYIEILNVHSNQHSIASVNSPKAEFQSPPLTF